MQEICPPIPFAPQKGNGLDDRPAKKNEAVQVVRVIGAGFLIEAGAIKIGIVPDGPYTKSVRTLTHWDDVFLDHCRNHPLSRVNWKCDDWMERSSRLG